MERVRNTKFSVVMRGYDRNAVDKYVADVAQLVAELEATQLRENVVQRALDEVGEQTSSILQRAHEAAEEIENRSRSQAEGRLQRAEREAELTRREAERYAEELAAETRRLWEDRLRLIEDMRQLADEVLGVADDALERLPEPEALVAGEAMAPELSQPEPGSEPAIPADLLSLREAAPATELQVEGGGAEPAPEDQGEADLAERQEAPAPGLQVEGAGAERQAAPPEVRGEGDGAADQEAPAGDPDESTVEFPSPAHQQPKE